MTRANAFAAPSDDPPHGQQAFRFFNEDYDDHMFHERGSSAP
jgi:hypothetical protein